MYKKRLLKLLISPFIVLMFFSLSYGQPTIDPPVNNLFLSEGETFTETVTVTIPPQEAAVPKVDIYFLCDTTGSMGSVIDTVKSQANSLLTQIASIPGIDVQFGVGEYKDFPYDPYAFRNNSAMSSDISAAVAGINMWWAGGGADGSEANLYALYKITTDAIGFRDDAKKIVIWFGDWPGHDPVPDSFTSLGFDLVEADTVAALVSSNITVIAINANSGWLTYGLDDDPAYDAWDYPDPRGGTPGQATRIATATNGQLFDVSGSGAGVTDAIMEGITSEVYKIDVLKLVPNGDVMGFTTSITPAEYTNVEPGTTGISLDFTVTFTGKAACSDVPFNYTLDAVGDGGILVSKDVNITVPSCITNHPSDCSKATADNSVIWPPNHNMVDIGIAGVTDPDGDSISITVTGITQDEPVNDKGDGNTAPDGSGMGTSTASVRAERSGTPKVPGDGRVYHIGFTADDGNGGTCTGEVTVCVPHDQKKGAACVDQGTLFDSTLSQ